MVEAIWVELSTFQCRIDTAPSNLVESSAFSCRSIPFPSVLQIEFALGRIDTANSNRVYFIVFNRIVTG